MTGIIKSLLNFLQEGEQLVKKIGGVFAFKVEDGPGGKEATWVVDVKNGKGSVTNDAGMHLSDCQVFLLGFILLCFAFDLFCLIVGLKKL